MDISRILEPEWVRVLNPSFFIGSFIALYGFDFLILPILVLKNDILLFLLFFIITLLSSVRLIGDLKRNLDFKIYKILDRRDLHDFISMTHSKVWFQFGRFDDLLIKVDGGGRFNSVSNLEDSLSEVTGLDLISKFQDDNNLYIYDFSFYKTDQEHMKKSHKMGAYVGSNGTKVIMLSKDLNWNYHRYPHAIIAGKTNSGKSVALFDLIVPQLLAWGCSVHVSDVKREHEFDYINQDYKGTIDYCSTALDTIKMVRLALEEVKNRQNRLYNYQKEHHGQKPNLDTFFNDYFVVIDELQTVTEKSKERKELIEKLTRLVQLARSVRVYLIVSVQVASVSNSSSALSSEARSQFGLKLLCGDNDKIVEREMFDTLDRDLKHTNQTGEAYARIDGMPGNSPRRILIPYFDDEEKKK